MPVAALRAVAVGALLPLLAAVVAASLVPLVTLGPAPARSALAAAAVLAGLTGLAWTPGALRRRTLSLGAALTGVAVVGAVALGAIDLGTLSVAAVLAVPLTPVAVPVIERVSRWVSPGWLVGLVLVVAAWGMGATISGGGAFGHDESAYLVQARAWTEGTPATGVSLHRAPGLSVLAMPLVALDLDEEGIRVVAAGIALASLAAVGWLARRTGGHWAPVLAMTAIATGLPFLRRGSEFLTDIPAAGLLVVAAVLTWDWLEQGRVSRLRMVGLGLGIVAAFYLRYQSALAGVALLAGAAVTWPGRLRVGWRWLGWAAVPALGALIPHLVEAVERIGSPLGLVLTTSGAAGRAYLGEGLADYARLFPTDLAGPLTALLVVASLAGLAFDRSAAASDRRRSRFLVVAALAVIVPLGIVAHGEPRFVFFPLWLLAVDGARWMERWAQRASTSGLGRAATRAVLAAIVVGAVGLAADTVSRVDRNAEHRAAGFQVLVDVAEAVQAPGCRLASSYQPQLTYYSGCPTELLPDSLDDLDTTPVTVVLFEEGKRPPQPEVRQQLLELGGVERIPAATDVPGDATLVAVDQDPSP